MGHLNIISLLWLVLMYFYAKYLLKQDELLRNRLIKLQLVLVLLYNIGLIIVFPWKLPVELSTISYFIVPAIVLFNIKSLHVWGVYTSIFIGSIYYLAMILIGNFLYADYPTYSVLTSIFNHGTLLLYAYVTLHTTKFEKSENAIVWIGLLFSSAWALSLKAQANFSIRIFVYVVLDAELITTYFSDNLTTGYIIYYTLLIIFLLLSANLVLILNQKLYQRHIPKQKA